MGRAARLFALLAVGLVAVPVVATLGPSTARACSCAAIDPIDAVFVAEVVFTGTAGSNEGSENEPVWRFAVDGVVKGDVSPVEVVIGEDWGIGCGTDFGRFSQPVVVYATRASGELRAIGCMPTPTAEAFAAQLAAVSEPTGTGPPEVVMVGTYGVGDLADLAVLDGRGRTITRTQLGLGAGSVAHCPGTTRVAVVAPGGSATMSIVDLATLTVLDERTLRSGFVSVTGDRLACFDGGERVVAAVGYGPDEGSVVVAISNSAAAGLDDARHRFDGVSRAVIHRLGTVLILPTVVGDPVRTLSAIDLEPAGAEVPLPDGASTLDADVSPDGSKLAVLATLSGRPVQWDTGATHVIILDVAGGVPVPDSAEIVPLPSPGDDIEDGNGAAKWIRWVDGQTWIIEYETASTKNAEFLRTDGTQVLPPTDVGWGWGLVPLDSGVLRARNGGLEVIAPDGTAVEGDPAPSNVDHDRILALGRLVDAPPFELATAQVAPLAITPIAPAGVGDPTPPLEEPDPVDESDTEPNVVADEPVDGRTVAPAAPDPEPGTRSVLSWIVGGGVALGALLVVGRLRWRRRAVV